MNIMTLEKMAKLIREIAEGLLDEDVAGVPLHNFYPESYSFLKLNEVANELDIRAKKAENEFMAKHEAIHKKVVELTKDKI